MLVARTVFPRLPYWYRLRWISCQPGSLDYQAETEIHAGKYIWFQQSIRLKVYPSTLGLLFFISGRKEEMNLKCNAYILADQLRRRGYQVSTIINNPDLSCNMVEEIKPYSATKENSGVAIYMDRYYGRSLYGYQNKELPLTILCFCSQDTNEELDDHWNWIFASSSKDVRKNQADLEFVQRELTQWQDDIAQSVDNPAEFKQFAHRIAKYQRNPVIVTDPAYALVSCGGSIPAPEYIDDPLLAALFECNNEGFRLMEEPLSQSLKKRFGAGDESSNECEHRIFAITDSGGYKYGHVLIPALNVPIDDAENSYFKVAMEVIREPSTLRKLKYSYRSLLKNVLVDGVTTSGIQGHLMESFTYCYGWKCGELYRLILVASRGNSSIDATVVRLAMIGIKETLPSCDVFADRQGKMIILDRIGDSDRSPADATAIDAGLIKLCRDHHLRMASTVIEEVPPEIWYGQFGETLDAASDHDPAKRQKMGPSILDALDKIGVKEKDRLIRELYAENHRLLEENLAQTMIIEEQKRTNQRLLDCLSQIQE